MATAAKKVVVLVHGLGSHPWMMWLLGKRLSQRGYRVENWGYRSTRRSLESHGRDLARHLKQLDADPAVGKLFLVTHSMGGIVARTALAEYRPAKLKRMVMLCPPNRGSRVATLFGPLLKSVCCTIDQLAHRPDSYVNKLPVPDQLDVGIIAASFDTLVPLASTYLGVERDHIVWPYTLHTGVLFRAGVADQVAHFLKHGAFQRDPQLAEAS